MEGTRSPNPEGRGDYPIPPIIKKKYFVNSGDVKIMDQIRRLFNFDGGYTLYRGGDPG